MKYLHTMLRVGNLETSLEYYTQKLEFKLLSRDDFPDGEFTLAFLRAPGDDDEGPCIELTYNWGVASYEQGGAYGHLAFSVDDMEAFRSKIRAKGLDFSWGPKPSPSGRSAIAFLTDPDGYKIELIERKGPGLS
jgi:lactoylglutathione lyase